MAQQLILQEDFPSLGYTGDVVTVKAGYARNFLIPRGLAVDASSQNGRLLQHKMAGIQAKRSKLKTQAEEFGKTLSAMTLEFNLKLGEGGKTFGAVTARDIEAAFKAKGIEINKKQIRLTEPLKTSGTYRVDIKIHAEVSVPVTVKVIAEAPPKKETLEGAASPKKGGKKKASKRAEGESEEQDISTDVETDEE